jgi:hypothetical protein
MAACAAEQPAASADPGMDVCVPVGESRPLKELPESSGVALSRRTPGVLWSQNDSGRPVILALSTAGSIQGRVQIANAAVQDWEDVSVGACDQGSCLYIADIGDNNTARRTITIYRVPEPEPGDGQSAAADAFTLRYPDGAHDAEAVFIAGEAIFLITKGPSTTLYRIPGTPRPGAEVTLERVADLPLKRVTDAETSVDGAWVTVRTNEDVVFYQTADLVRGKADGVTVSVRALKEPQGEGVALADDGTLYLTSEGGGGGRFSAMRCAIP